MLLLAPLAPAKTKKAAKKSNRSSCSVQTVKTKAGKKKSKLVCRKQRGQQAIDGERARQIQAALIRENYLDGEPSGVWDQRTREAMARFQNDNGWQTKVLPDSRALIKLGLGPDQSNLLNPETAQTSLVETTPLPKGSESAPLPQR